ncbi:hypothetical protein BKH41_05360 [Helicobacter sp. 12S02232-10]|uniref:hypothetical protein n=1 Tax=Helicobacter sp. 12S02232-10 TaxID=1476197 RepID=UPI000BA539E3|nr:hypothetical protein [Helicobacter sp. 12S02232-10]PAF48696.1 hypothetical protein BKH41_05360 [Helicobacter sp. 12S02232-10]
MSVLGEYNQLSNKHCFENISFLAQNNLNFCILCDLSKVSFEPLLPKEILEKFGPFVLFVLAGYTFESLRVFEDGIEFEAGFGKNNIGSVVSVRLEGIIQVIIKDGKDENIVLFNRYDMSSVFGNSDEEAMQDSMEAILSNPQNREIMKALQKNGKS